MRETKVYCEMAPRWINFSGLLRILPSFHPAPYVGVLTKILLCYSLTASKQSINNGKIRGEAQSLYLGPEWTADPEFDNAARVMLMTSGMDTPNTSTDSSLLSTNQFHISEIKSKLQVIPIVMRYTEHCSSKSSTAFVPSLKSLTHGT